VGLLQGAYVLADLGMKDPEVILMASGSEVELIVRAGEKLAEEGHGVRLISFPSWELFARQEQGYRERVLPASIPARVAVEAGVTLGWDRWIGPQGIVIGVDRFGASAPYKQIYAHFGLTVAEVVQAGRATLARVKNQEVAS
jgi:transketolase